PPGATTPSRRRRPEPLRGGDQHQEAGSAVDANLEPPPASSSSSRHRTAPSRLGITTPRPRLPLLPKPVGSSEDPEDPDYFDDVDYAEEKDKDNTPGVHAHPIFLTY
ncbi:unnamed protein product, partial [Urochloa humidicola]